MTTQGTRAPVIALIATLDTKGAEIAFVREVLQTMGTDSLIIDSGIINTPAIEADIPREEVAEAGGRTLQQVQDSGSRGAAVELMQDGLRVLARDLFREGRINGALCLGGGEGAQLGSAFMQELPLGIPKVIVSPSASGRRAFAPFMGSSDILVMHSVIDILGLNAVARTVFTNAAAAVAGMCRWGSKTPSSDRPIVGITMLGQTTPGVEVVAATLEEAGYEPMIFHANGVGGPAMDGLVRDGVISGVIDYTLSELANTHFDGVHTAGPDRMRAAIKAGIPLVVVPGAIDFFNQGALDTVPAEYTARKHYKHNPVATLVRVEKAEMVELAQELTRRLDGATAPVSVVTATRGFSLIGVDGGPIDDSEADETLNEALGDSLPDSIPLTIIEDHVNSADFARSVAAEFLRIAGAPS